MKRYSKQQIYKMKDKQCHFCPTSDYSLLDVHRIKPGAEGGKYTEVNCVTTCSNCHRRIHAGEITIDRWYSSTVGRVLHYFENNQEHWQ